MEKNQTQRRPRGRPRSSEPATCVSTRLRPSEHDRLIRLASKHSLSVSELVRRLLTVRLP